MQLEIEIGGSNEGSKLKAENGWYQNGNGSDDFDFAALPGGFRHYLKIFDRVGEYSVWWTATQYDTNTNYAWCRALVYEDSLIERREWDLQCFSS